ncbi:stonustoxin subunit beta-like [Amia ocellicauda]|uniref:stonustoxin subunit beta-like n=1 Tax=Amia ocellicauda TaxID=2972642 RepID=UPI0034642D07
MDQICATSDGGASGALDLRLSPSPSFSSSGVALMETVTPTVQAQQVPEDSLLEREQFLQLARVYPIPPQALQHRQSAAPQPRFPGHRPGHRPDHSPGHSPTHLLISASVSLTDACRLTLDPNTAHRHLSLSERNRKVTWETEESPPDHPERFDWWEQVLCREGLTGCCYWEVECNGGFNEVGVTYKGIIRKGSGEDCQLGCNDKSWSLECWGSSCTARHNNNETAIPVPPPHRVAVYLDWPASTLSFYSVSSDTLTLLHTLHSTFTEPLYPGFGVYDYGSSVSLCQLE